MSDDELRLTRGQIENCLKCRIGFQTVYDYKDMSYIIREEEEIRSKLKQINDLYGDYSNRKNIEELSEKFGVEETHIEDKLKKLKEIKKQSKINSNLILECVLDENNQAIIQEFSELLEIPGTIEEKYCVLKQLSPKGGMQEEDFCFWRLKQIICAIYPLYQESEILSLVVSGYRKEVLTVMNNLNQASSNDYKHSKADEALNNFIGDCEDKSIIQELKNIFEKFCCSEPKGIKNYERFSCPDSLGYIRTRLNDEAKHRSELKGFFDRIEGLNHNSQKIILDYLYNAPKEIGKCLNPIMIKQNMTTSDLENLTGIKSNAIQQLQKDKVSEIEQDKFILLCRALLVSEDVLQKGKGKIYGNWKVLLDTEGIKAIQKTAKDKGIFIEEIKGIRKNREFVRAQIKSLIKMNDNEYNELIQNNPALFEVEDYSLEDYELYDALLNKDEAYVLLEVLEKLESYKE